MLFTDVAISKMKAKKKMKRPKLFKFYPSIFTYIFMNEREITKLEKAGSTKYPKYLPQFLAHFSINQFQPYKLSP